MKKIIEKVKELWKDGALYIIAGSFATKFATLFGSVFIVRLMTKDDYGLLGYIENLYSFVIIIAGMGMSNAALRYIVLGDSINRKKGYYSYIMRKSTIYNILLVGIIVIINIFYIHPNGFESAEYLLSIMLIMLPFQYCTENNLSAERAMFQNKRYSIISFLSAISIVVGKILGASIGGIESVVVATVLVNFLFGICTTKMTNKRYFSDIKSIYPNKAEKKEMDIYSIQYMVTNGLWTLFMLSDVFLLSKFGATKAEIADYKIAYVWPANIGIIGSCIAVYITPYFVKYENNLKWIRSNFIKVYSLNMGITIFIAAAIFVLSKPLILLYAGEKYLNTISLMRVILIGATINNGLRMMTANALAAMGQVRYNMIVSMIGIVAQVLINIMLIPKFGTFAVAYTSIIVYSFMAIVLLIIFIKRYYLKMK